MKILTRADVGARPFKTPPPRVLLAQRREVTWHYPGAGTPPRDIRGLFRWIERIHMDQNGWRGVGYNFIVAADGTIGEGCGRDVRGAHSPPHNVDGLGVMLWTNDGVPPPAVLRSARLLHLELSRQAGRTLSVGWHGRDFPTECPGPAVRRWAQAGMPVPAPPKPTAPVTPSKAPSRAAAVPGWWHVDPRRVSRSLVGLNSAGRTVTTVRPGQALDVRRLVTRWGHRWAVTRWGTYFRLDHLAKGRAS